MYSYNLSVAMANKKFSYYECPEMIGFLKEAIAISNSSFSATRHKRTIEYKNQIDEKHIHLIMKSRDDINPTRSLSSLSRALFRLEKEKGTNLLEACTSNGCLFNAIVIEDPKKPISLSELQADDSLLLKSVVDLVYSSDSNIKQKLQELILIYINNNR